MLSGVTGRRSGSLKVVTPSPPNVVPINVYSCWCWAITIVWPMAGSPLPTVAAVSVISPRVHSCEKPKSAVPVLVPRPLTTPAGPAGPAGPVAPAVPAGPAGPAGPVAPAGPEGPAGPGEPAAPMAPVAPVAPCVPFGPAGPAGP